MASYTTEVRHLVEFGFDLGLDEYPIFDEAYRPVLNKKILDRYWFREIGQETAAKFRHYLKMRMNEIMPYYNKLYESELIHIEPLTRLDQSEQYNWNKSQSSNRTTTDTVTQSDVNESVGTSNSTSTGSADSGRSDTPASKLSWSGMETGDYLTEASITRSEETGNTETSANSTNKLDREGNLEDSFNLTDTESYIKRITGNNGMRTDSAMLMEFRKTFLNIDMMILDELEDLFMLVY